MASSMDHNACQQAGFTELLWGVAWDQHGEGVDHRTTVVSGMDYGVTIGRV